MTKDEALKLALEALNDLAAWNDGEVGSHMDEPYAAEVARSTITAIKEALAQPEPWEKFCDSNCVWTDHHPDCKLAEQEPVGYWMGEFNDGAATLYEVPQKSVFGRTYRNIPVYTTPPQRKPLTDEQLLHFVNIHVGAPSMAYPLDNSDWINFARAIEAAHGIKGQA